MSASLFSAGTFIRFNSCENYRYTYLSTFQLCVCFLLQTKKGQINYEKQPKRICKFCASCAFTFCTSPRKRRLFRRTVAIEAISETYIPLLLNFGKLENEHVDFR